MLSRSCFSLSRLNQAGGQCEFVCPSEALLDLQYVIDADAGDCGDLFRRWPLELLGEVSHTGRENFHVRVLLQKILTIHQPLHRHSMPRRECSPVPDLALRASDSFCSYGTVDEHGECRQCIDDLQTFLRIRMHRPYIMPL